MHFHYLGNNHAHRGSPIAEMNVRNNLMSDKLFNPTDRLADNRRAQMPDMHGFGNIGAAGIDNDIFGIFSLGAAQPFVGADFIHQLGNKSIVQREVDEPRAVNRNLSKIPVLLQLGGNLRGDFARVFAFALGQSQSAVALQVAQVGAVGHFGDGKPGIQS